MEISDSISSEPIEFDFQEKPVELVVKVPKGFGAITESSDLNSKAPKPGPLWKFSLWVFLSLFQWATSAFHFVRWVLKSIFGLSSRQKILYQKLHEISERRDQEEIRAFLSEYSEEPFVAGYLFSEFLYLPELHFCLVDILQGANICFEEDQGFFCRRWSQHPESYKRSSSHKYQRDECYGLGHFLFFLDSEGNTRFQFENSPWGGDSMVDHIVDFLRYRRDNEQQGVTGTSSYTEEYCIKIKVDLVEFLQRT